MGALFGGEFHVRIPGGPQFKRHNLVVSTGTQATMQLLWQGQAALPDTLYFGLCKCDYTYDTTLAEVIDSEPVGNGYARVAMPRDVAHWPMTHVGDSWVATSAYATFTATTDWTSVWRQCFISTVAAGSVGTLIAISAKYTSDIQTLAGSPPTINYAFTSGIETTE